MNKTQISSPLSKSKSQVPVERPAERNAYCEAVALLAIALVAAALFVYMGVTTQNFADLKCIISGTVAAAFLIGASALFYYRSQEIHETNDDSPRKEVVTTLPDKVSPALQVRQKLIGITTIPQFKAACNNFQPREIYKDHMGELVTIEVAQALMVNFSKNLIRNFKGTLVACAELEKDLNWSFLHLFTKAELQKLFCDYFNKKTEQSRYNDFLHLCESDVWFMAKRMIPQDVLKDIEDANPNAALLAANFKTYLETHSKEYPRSLVISSQSLRDHEGPKGEDTIIGDEDLSDGG